MPLAGERQRPGGYGRRCGMSVPGAPASRRPCSIVMLRDRKAEQAEALLKGCHGFLHADAYGFNNLYRPDSLTGDVRLVEVACWAHARRKLYEVHEATKSPAAKELLERIGRLFAIEAEIRGQTPQER